MAVIKSLMDNDLYKFTMQRAVLQCCPKTPVKYIFHNRRPEGKFNQKFLDAFNAEVEAMSELRLVNGEVGWLILEASYLGEEYIRWLHAYRYRPREVSAKIVNGELELSIMGPWEQTILWEVPLMAIISELYFTHCDTDWDADEGEQEKRIRQKADILRGLTFADFGTRRRRSFDAQERVVRLMKNFASNFVGTSNVHLAHKHEVLPTGTMAHEWIMGMSVLEGMRHANRHALRKWAEVYKGDLGTALPDTFGTPAFWTDFDGYLGRLFDSIRHDSGDPIPFIEQTIEGYNKLRIDPRTKTIIFSDGLDAMSAQRISQHCCNRIKCAFGIGTNLTNDFSKRDGKPSKALNMVIKLAECKGVPVVKLSDVPSKAIGDKDALRIARWTFYNTPLDAA